MEHVLVIEDEKDIAELIEFNLKREGYYVRNVFSGEDALIEVSKFIPDIIILDIMLPGIDGFEICTKIRNDPKLKKIPILMLTAKSEDEDIIHGLETGADDYITKPFSPKVLLARINAISRRSKVRNENKKLSLIEIHNLVIDITKHQVKLNDDYIDLSATEFSLLEFLAKNPGWVFSRSQIISAIRGSDYPVTDRSVDVQILSLRKKLGKYDTIIETIRGIGYRMKEEQDA
jgi:two-component system phosphate regulon response regulator PhoB